jgi:tRNA A-37 threonylcarbamoyl transferase component Bud32/Fe2+ or Zn2+ uptake regulation protein
MTSLLMKPLAGRFSLLSLVGEGGMGSVWKARDLVTKDLVAVKLLNLNVNQTEELARFEREVALLAELNHPGIVRYLAHGQTDTQAYLVMEWLEGQDLARRLAKGPLRPTDGKKLFSRVTEVLVEAHRKGIIHRDIKPSNLFLRRGQFDDVVVLDFGVARKGALHKQLTRTGVLVGTPEYMSPEQARGLRDITFAADLFGLGCVMFEVFTGQKPFSAKHITGLLSKILFEPAPSLHHRKPALPRTLSELVADLLEKDPARRPQSTEVVQERLSKIVVTDDESAAGDIIPTTLPPLDSLSEKEMSLFTTILATPLQQQIATNETAKQADAATYQARMMATVERLRTMGLRAEFLGDWSVWAAATQSPVATDLAHIAMQGAVVLRHELRGFAVVVATGLFEHEGPLASGPGFDLLQSLLSTATTQEAALEVVMDDVTSELIADRFHVTVDTVGVGLLGARLGESARLARNPPWCGLDRELSMLLAGFEGVETDQVFRAVVFSGPPGSGKTRLLDEFLQRLAEDHSTAVPLVARLWPQSVATPLSVPLGWLHSAEQVVSTPHGPAPLWRAFIEHRYPPEKAKRYVAILSGLLTAGPATKRTAESVVDRVGIVSVVEALSAFVTAISRPCVLAIDALQWIDAASIEVVTRLTHTLLDLPVLLLGMARPDLREIHPRIFDGLPIDHVSIQRYTNKPIQKSLVRLNIDGENKTQALLEHSQGLPLLFHWLVRDMSSGSSCGQRAVAFMTQARTRRLDPQTRQVLRAASLLQRPFSEADLLHFLPSSLSVSDIYRSLRALVENNWFEPVQLADGGRCFKFRYSPERSAIFETLTSADKRLGADLLAALESQNRDQTPSKPS